MGKKLRGAIVGVGGMGTGHLWAYKHDMADTVEIVAICDIAEGRAEARKQEFGFDCDTYLDFNEMMKRDDIDFVDIATPNYLHPVVAIAALNSGKNVFSEKPDCITVEQAEDMKKAAEDNKKVLMVMRNNRYYDASVYAKNLAAEGFFGDFYSGRCGWIRRRGIPGRGGWFTTKAQSGGGPLIDLGVHMIDLSIWLMGNPKPVAVSGSIFNKFAENTASADSVHACYGEAVENGTFDVEDLAMGFIKFDNGACLQIEFSWASNIEHERRFVELRGSKAGLTWDNERIKLFTEDETGLKDIDHEFVEINGHSKNLQHFVDVIANGATPDFVPQQGVNMIKILNAIYESAKTGKEVTL